MARALGLRFAKQDAVLLRSFAAAVKNGEMPGAVSNFENAAIAAETGEPLIVYFTNPVEVVEMAASYVLHGCQQPMIEELSGT